MALQKRNLLRVSKRHRDVDGHFPFAFHTACIYLLVDYLLFFRFFKYQLIRSDFSPSACHRGSVDATGSILRSDFLIRNLGARGVSTVERIQGLIHWAVVHANSRYNINAA